MCNDVQHSSNRGLWGRSQRKQRSREGTDRNTDGHTDGDADANTYGYTDTDNDTHGYTYSHTYAHAAKCMRPVQFVISPRSRHKCRFIRA